MRNISELHFVIVTGYILQDYCIWLHQNLEISIMRSHELSTIWKLAKLMWPKTISWLKDPCKQAKYGLGTFLLVPYSRTKLKNLNI